VKTGDFKMTNLQIRIVIDSLYHPMRESVYDYLVREPIAIHVSLETRSSHTSTYAAHNSSKLI